MSASAGQSKKRRKSYHFHAEWEEEYFFTMLLARCVCLICRSTVAIPKKANVQRHFQTVHKSFDAEFPPNTELRRAKVKELKSQLSGQQSASKPRAETDASFRIDRATKCLVKLSVHPCRGLMDEKFIVLVQKAPSGFQLTIHALHRCEEGLLWHAFGHYTANTTGTVNVAQDPSVGGTYSGVEQMGLLWSLIPVSGSNAGLRLRKMNIQTPMEVTICLYRGHQTEGFVDQVPLAAVVVERWYMAPGVCRIPVTEGGLAAALFLPSGSGLFPGILDLWGGGGKLVEYRAALLASHGFACLALDFMTPKITLERGKLVDNQYFETAYRVLQQHPRILGSRIAILGLSLGTCVALHLAVYSQVVKFVCAICINGTHVQPVEEQPVEGVVKKTLDFLKTNSGKTRFTEDNEMIWRDLLLPIPTDPKLKVDVGRLKCPLLMIVSEDDQSWPSHESVMDMKVMMERAGNSHLLTILSYPNAGHLIEPPYTPHTRVCNFRTLTETEPVMLMALWGGETVAHSRAQEDSWKKILVFLRENLYGWGEASNP